MAGKKTPRDSNSDGCPIFEYPALPRPYHAVNVEPRPACIEDGVPYLWRSAKRAGEHYIFKYFLTRGCKPSREVETGAEFVAPSGMTIPMAWPLSLLRRFIRTIG